MSKLPLGKSVPMPAAYDPSVLFAIPRSAARQHTTGLPDKFDGHDIWNLYEVSWLNPAGRPEVRRARVVYSAASANIVESKSLKLYIGSFIMGRFDSDEQVRETIRRDLAEILHTPSIDVRLYSFADPFDVQPIDAGELIDDQPIAIDTYTYNPRLLETEACGGESVSVASNLLKTNCPITGQPDWGTVRISYRAKQRLRNASLLKYIVSFRDHAGYHEACCEQIFADLFTTLDPEQLIVKCHFTRRGGIDIAPCRFFGCTPDGDYDARYWRQ